MKLSVRQSTALSRRFQDRLPARILHNPCAATVRPVVGFVGISDKQTDVDDVSELMLADVHTLKDRVVETAAFTLFQRLLNNKPALQADWLSFTSRPWVQGPVDAFLGNTHLAAMMSQHKELAAMVEELVTTLDTALMQGGHVPWLLHVVQHCAGHSGMYVIMQSVEEMLGPHHISRLERLTYAALTRPRAVKLMAVLVALLTPETVESLLQLAKATLTDERLTRLMDAAEYVVSEDDRMGLAGLALDSLSDAVTDESLLHFIATLDTQVDLQLLVHTGQELLEALLQDPEASGQQLGSLLDAVADMHRLERTVARNDEVMTLDRIAVLHKVLAQVSPAGSPENITAAISALRSALASHSIQTWLSAASSEVTVGEVKAWWQAFDAALATQHIEALLDAVEALLDGGRIWALLGQPQPALEMLLLADEEARAATCRSRCGSSSRSSSGGQEGPFPPTAETGPTIASGKAAQQRQVAAAGAERAVSPRPGSRLSLSSRDDWVVNSLGSMDEVGTASTSSTGSALSAAAAAAAAAASAAAEAAAVAPACALDDRDCQDCSGRCGSPVERAFASGSQLSDPDLARLIRAALRDIRPYRLARQRAAAQANAQQAVASASAAAAAAVAANSEKLRDGDSGGSMDTMSVSSILASLDWAGGHHSSGSPLSSLHLHTAGHATTDAQENAGTAAAAAVAVAAAAAASQGGTCSLAAPAAVDLSFPPVGLLTPSAAHSSSSSSVSEAAGPEADTQLVRVAIHGAAGVARAVLKPRRLRSFFDLAADMLAPQRLAITMAVLDTALKIGEHSVAVGPVCEISTRAGSNGSGSSDGGGSNGSQSSSSGNAAAVLEAAAALVAAVPSVVSQRLLDAALGAAADLAAGPRSRKHLLHAVDTVLTLATLQQELQLLQHQRKEHTQLQPAARQGGRSSGHTLLSAADSTSAPAMQVERATAVVHCALGDTHSCVTAEELAAAAGSGNSTTSSSSGSSGGRLQLWATVLGLHVGLTRDLWQLWWAYHTRLALNLGTTRA